MDYQTICTSPFAVRGNAIKRARPDTRTIRKRALSALVHNYIQSQAVFKRLKKLQKRHNGFECYLCKKIVRQLDIAHARETVIDMVNSILDAHPDKPIEELFIMLLDIHELPDTLFVVCCAACNKELEKEFNRCRTDQSTHTEQPLVIVPSGTVEDLLGVGINDE